MRPIKEMGELYQDKEEDDKYPMSIPYDFTHLEIPSYTSIDSDAKFMQANLDFKSSVEIMKDSFLEMIEKSEGKEVSKSRVEIFKDFFLEMIGKSEEKESKLTKCAFISFSDYNYKAELE
jgi:hypothetical protein